jgi:hypothetical protein
MILTLGKIVRSRAAVWPLVWCGLFVFLIFRAFSPLAGSYAAIAAEPRPKIAAAKLIDMIGVNIHMQYADGAYGDLSKVLQLFKFLGVKHARDVVPVGAARGIVRRMAYDGIRFDFFVSDDWKKGGFLDYAKNLEHNVPGVIASVEGYNEINNSSVKFDGLQGAEAAFVAQRQLYSSIKADPDLSHIPVLDLTGFEMVRHPEAESRTSLQGYADVMNVHAYAQNGNQPGTWIGPGVPEIYSNLNDNLPKAVTEFGYASFPQSGWLVIGVDEPAQAKGIVNGLFDAAAFGFERVYVYELLDQRPDPASANRELHFGLFTSDYRPKLAAQAISNVIRILSGSAISRAAASSLSIEGKIEIKPESAIGEFPVRSLQIARSDGVALVAVWRETPFWDRPKGRPLEEPSIPAKVLFASGCRSTKIYDVLRSSEPISVAEGDTASLFVGDHVQLVECAK